MGALSFEAAIGLRAVDQDRPLVFPPADPEAFETGVWAGGLRFDHVHDYSYDGLMRSYEQSHMRLGMNRIDLLIIHDLDFWFHATEQKVTAHLNQLFTSGWRALDQLRKHKLIRGVGAGINEVGMMPRFLDMVASTSSSSRFDTRSWSRMCWKPNFPIVNAWGSASWSAASSIPASPDRPIKGAKYNYADATPEVLAKVEKIRRLQEARHADGGSRAAIPLAHPIVASAIPLGISPEQVGERRALSLAGPGGLMERPQREGMGSERSPIPKCRLPP